MIKVVFATNNAHKVSEFRSCFEQMGVEAEILTLKDVGFKGDIIEDADTFEGNAHIKAHTLCEFSGLISVADDSGLVVDALGGAPGVYSARYAGENASDQDNIDKLLAELNKYPDRERDAKFVCSLCVCRPDGETLYVNGESEGVIIDEMKGDGRFGYDPIFYYPPFDKTFAEMTSEEKNSISHRGRAIEKLLKHKEFFDI
ncbi:MAG: XTP/dITP diphosphatase [Clostridia bacterium]|nr:XTP/dITP diphosphatase [Clostridia bacterium]